MSQSIDALTDILLDLQDVHTDRESGTVSQADLNVRVSDAVDRLRDFLATRSPNKSNVWSSARPELADSAANLIGEAIGKLDDYLNGGLDWYTAFPKAEGRIESARGFLSIDQA